MTTAGTVVLVVVLVVLVVAATVIAAIGFWSDRPWRPFGSAELVLDVPAEIAWQRLAYVVAARRGWRLVSPPDWTWMRIVCGATLWSWRRRIDVEVRALGPELTLVRVQTSAPQLVDRGEGRRVLAELAGAIGARS